MPIIIPNCVRAHTRWDPVILVGVELSLSVTHFRLRSVAFREREKTWQEGSLTGPYK